MNRIRFSLAAVLALAGAFLVLTFTVAPSVAQAAPRGCSSIPYSYAGIQTAGGTHGVQATITAVQTPRVATGHVAGWVGVGGPGEGANSADAWIQIGINALPGTGNVIYAEAWIPGTGHAYKELGQVPAGRKVKVAVLEVNGRPGTWRAWLNGEPVTKEVFLPGSQNGAWQADAIAESWTGGGRACNDYQYKFENVAAATVAGGAWKRVTSFSTVQDPGHRILQSAPSTFIARAS